MPYQPQNPVIVQGDKTVLLEVQNDLYEAARDHLARFAELEKSPEYVHTYRITPLSLWNAAAAGLRADAILGGLESYAKFDIPDNVRRDIFEYVGRYGRVKLLKGPTGELLLVSDDTALLVEIERHKDVRNFIVERIDATHLRADPAQRGYLKRALVGIGYPAEDLAGYVDGAPLPIRLRQAMVATGDALRLRHYQEDAIGAFWAGGEAGGGSGVIVLPCGAGKTLVGMGAMERLSTNTLILCPSTVAVRQWIRELLDKTSLGPDDVGEYTGLAKEIRPVTVTTYQVLTWHRGPQRKFIEPADFPHFKVFDERDWGLIIYDEVHLLPAPVFRITAELQARRRLGLTATLVREDGMQEEVFSLVGPKKYDVPWKELEKQGWIATAECHEIRIPLPPDLRMEYALANEREKHRLAAENPAKVEVLEKLLAKHKDDTVLIIGQYIDQIERVSRSLGAPLITGKTPVREREELFQKLREGQIKHLVISKVGNFAVDLPEANVMLQISGAFGSRQEEAQRLGRILRPKRNGLLAHFYSLVSRDTTDQSFGAHRQMFLTEQGYRYDILYDHEIDDYEPITLELEAEPVLRALPSGQTATDTLTAPDQ
ncbi:MAG: DEAD/DEAH box helicase [Caldilineales bacterium]|nr:DEAD/DEAH box helicase [Caldilineales bacterium]